MTPRRVAVAVLVLATACGGSEPGPRPPPAAAGPSLPPTLTPSPTAQGYGHPLAWAPDGLLTVGEKEPGPSPLRQCPSPQPRVSIVLHASGTERTVADEPALFEPAWSVVSPDGAHLAVLGFCDEEFIGVLGIVPLRGGRARMVPMDEDTAYGTPFALQTVGWLSPTELLAMRLSFHGEELRREAVGVNVTTLAVRVVLTGADLSAVRPLPGGRLLVLSGRQGEHRVEVQEPDGKRRALGPAFDAHPSPDGALVAAYTEEEADSGTLRLLPVDGGKGVTAKLPGSIASIQWSPRSDRLVVSTESGETRRVYVVTARGSVHELVLPGGEDSLTVWSPEGNRLAYGTEDGEIRVVAI